MSRRITDHASNKRHLISFIISSLILLFSFSLQGQDLTKLISQEICRCIGSPENLGNLETKLDSCLNTALENVISLLDDEQQEMLADEQAINDLVEEVSGKFLYYCPEIRNFILTEKQKMNYRMSGSEKANEFYNEGTKAYEAGEYRKAEKSLLKAVKTDPVWVFPYDYLGHIYSAEGKYKKAIKYYNRSLSIYPEGPVALQNLALVYISTKAFDKALRNYTLMVFLYPDNPEGYTGAANVQYLSGKYEEALEYALYSFKMFGNLGAEYKKDSEKLISEIRNKLRENGKGDVFENIARKFGLDPDDI